MSDRLTPAQLRACQLDVQGLSRGEVADQLGMSQSAVKSWRALTTYQEEVARLTTATTDPTDTDPDRDDAREVLRQQLRATLPNGSPNDSLRHRAAKILLADKSRPAAAGTSPNQPLVIRIRLDRGPPDPGQFADPPTAPPGARLPAYTAAELAQLNI